MKVTLNWLKQYVDFNWSADETTERLTMLGLEVEGVQKLGGEFDGIVVAQVITRDKHPNADKLSLCRVNDGTGERQIVCGAQNFKTGDKIPLILPGASLPPKAGEKEPFTIKVGKIRGVESHGMLCSPQELGLPDPVDGLLILREDAKVGRSFAEYLGRSGGDIVFDLEITPNRPDLNSVIGIAREISAVTGNPLKRPEISEAPSESAPEAEALVSVRLDAPDLCPRYVARVIQGVKIGPSPDWLRHTLEKVGIRSINNVVDVTNYVMLETGQPLHAFDYHLIGQGKDGKPAIVVRRAAEGEKFKTLDNQERTLTKEMLLIADEQKAIALAGVMGGANTEINDQTVDVLIESAYFAPVNIRRTSKKLGLRTDASYRFERGADIGICDWASRRCAQLILETAGGHWAGNGADAFPNPVEAKEITLRHARTEQLLGISVPVDRQNDFLRRLSLEIIRSSPETTFLSMSAGNLMNADAPPSLVTVRIPAFRVDLKCEVDLIEEIARLHGVDEIPATSPRGAIGANAFDIVYDQISEARRILTGLGMNEAQGQTLVSKSDVPALPDNDIVPLANPLSADMDVLRPSLLPGLLSVLRHNLSRKNDDLAFFEIGRVFVRAGEPAHSEKLIEERRLAIALTGRRAVPFWSGENRDATFDISDLKGILEDFLEHFSLRGVSFSRRTEPSALFLDSAAVSLGGKVHLGELGVLLPSLAKKYDLRDAVLLAELNLDLLLVKRNPAKSFKSLPAFPAIRRDVAMLVPEDTTHESVLNVSRQIKPANLERAELFDVFRGNNLPEGQKSVAYAFTYRHAERTLTDAEVNAAHDKLVEEFKRKLNAVVR